MLSLLILWAMLSLAFFLVGAPVLCWTGLSNFLAKPGDRVFSSIWLGLVILANALLFASLFTPLTLYVAAPMILVALTPPLWKKSRSVLADLPPDRPMIAVLAGATLVVAFFSAFSTDILVDTGSYHHQMVNWLSEYGSVPGLALIHNRFGFTSSWFALFAPLQTGMLKDLLIVGLNSFVFLLAVLQALLSADRVLRRDAGVQDWFFLFAVTLLFHNFFFDLVYSLSPDLPAMLLTLVIPWLMLAIPPSAHAQTANGAIWAGVGVLILAAGAVSIKLSLVPLLPVALFYYLTGRGFTPRKAGVAAAIIMPFMATLMSVSTVTSGCPLYPSPHLCTALPWSLGSENARQMSGVILEFAKWSGNAPVGASGLDWLWRDLPSKNVFNDKPLMRWLLLVNVLCAAWLYSRRKGPGGEGLQHAVLVALAGIAFILAEAPHLRFGLGFFLIIPALAGALFFSQPARFTGKRYMFRAMPAALLIAASCYAVIPMMHRYWQLVWGEVRPADAWASVKHYAGIWAVRPGYPLSYPNLAIARAGNFDYLYPPVGSGGECWGARLPCAPGKIAESVWLRDEEAGLRKGFIKKESPLK